jgi:hypothetical protein
MAVLARDGPGAQRSFHLFPEFEAPIEMKEDSEA